MKAMFWYRDVAAMSVLLVAAVTLAVTHLRLLRQDRLTVRIIAIGYAIYWAIAFPTIIWMIPWVWLGQQAAK